MSNLIYRCIKMHGETYCRLAWFVYPPSYASWIFTRFLTPRIMDGGHTADREYRQWLRTTTRKGRYGKLDESPFWQRPTKRPYNVLLEKWSGDYLILSASIILSRRLSKSSYVIMSAT